MQFNATLLTSLFSHVGATHIPRHPCFSKVLKYQGGESLLGGKIICAFESAQFDDIASIEKLQ